MSGWVVRWPRKGGKDRWVDERGSYVDQREGAFEFDTREAAERQRCGHEVVEEAI